MEVRWFTALLITVGESNPWVDLCGIVNWKGNLLFESTPDGGPATISAWHCGNSQETPVAFRRASVSTSHAHQEQYTTSCLHYWVLRLSERHLYESGKEAEPRMFRDHFRGCSSRAADYNPSSLQILKTQWLAIVLLVWKIKLQLSYLQHHPILSESLKWRVLREWIWSLCLYGCLICRRGEF